MMTEQKHFRKSPSDPRSREKKCLRTNYTSSDSKA